MTVECLRFSPETARAREALQALSSAAAGVGIYLTQAQTYTATASWLLLWGPGAPNRFAPMADTLARGGHVVALDGAYWQRDRKFRISLDGAHPQRWVLRKELPASRYETDSSNPGGVTVREGWEPDGPVIVAGIGEKARAQYGAVVSEWEASIIKAARSAGRRVLYRPKGSGAVPAGVERAFSGPIETAIRGASVVATWHSNVAVDAIRQGIPVICRDGAAAAVCSSEWSSTLRPLPEAWRDKFLRNLAWFQWAPSEAADCWRFVRLLTQ